MFVVALVSGLLRGVEEATSSAVTDGYKLLVGQVGDRYGTTVATRIERLRTDPASKQNQLALAATLREAGGEQDPELHLVARQLIDWAEDPQGFQATQVDPVEQLMKFTGLCAIGEALEAHVGQVQAIRTRYSVEDIDLLTANIGGQRDIPAVERAQLAQLHVRIRQVIESIAMQMEDSRYRGVEHAVTELPTGLAERNRAVRLVRAEKSLHSSYESLRLTVEFLGELNRSILARIEIEEAPEALSAMMFGNAVLIYELSDFVIGYLRAFGLDNDLAPLHDEAIQRLRVARDTQRALLERLESDTAIDESVRADTIEDIHNRDHAINELEREWDEYLGDVATMERTVADVRRRLPTLEVIRENARIQIMTLQLFALLRFLKQNDRSIQGTVNTLAGFRLAPLTPTRVSRLLGMEVTAS
jgi:hypothetical protein